MNSRIAACGLGLAIALGCRAEGEAPRQPPSNADWIACEDPRPQMCTHDYRPVCAARDNGVRCVTTPCDSTDTRTYGNACSACADKKVVAWMAGECEAPDEAPE